ncbi:PSD1 and planctomycete cytochrome C domain-containing protein [Novipirellula rosea]
MNHLSAVFPVGANLTMRILTAILCLFFTANTIIAEELTAEELNFFEARIRPVLIRECYSCHSNQTGNARGGLKLDTKQLMHLGGESGPAIVPGEPEESLLYSAITHEDFVMPPKRKLSQKIINDFKTWIEMGAPDPRVNEVAKVNSTITAKDIQQAKESFWAYQKPQYTPPHKVERTDWPRTTIDRYILAKLEQAELTPSDDAEPYKILRRLTFDLIGLPPTPEQLAYFESAWKKDPDKAVEYVVDRLLSMDQFGERWGRHWLDVARYAESTGREVNMTYPQAWRYRDYVIDSFNADKPYNRFVQEQLAGDLLPAKSDEEWTENLVATAFLAIGSKNVNEENGSQFAADVVDEQIDVTSQVFLGMSVSCARCHDHKFDAIPQTDYYALAGIFKNMKTYFGRPQSEYGEFISTVQERQLSTLLVMPVEDPNPFDTSYSPAQLQRLKEAMDAKLEQLNAQRRRAAGERSIATQRQTIVLLRQASALSSQLATVDEKGQPVSFCMGVQETENPANARLLVRGEIDQPGELVKRGFPQVLTDNPVHINSEKSGRLELARWIGSDENPLTARVMVNRIWQHLIGHGIVRSTENFGVTGEMPTHPELLDYLAIQFVESGWSVKSLIREITTSRVYRMQSTYNEKNHEYDPDNTLVWRANPRRLDAEAIRDAMLSISGKLDLERPRASIVAEAGHTRVQDGQFDSGRPPEQQDSAGEKRGMNGMRGPGRGMFGRGGMSGQSNGTDRSPFDMESAQFRSVYLPVVRDALPRSMTVFDFPDASTITGTRDDSNTPNQALYMMNNPFVVQQGESFARRLAESNSQPVKQVEQAFLLAFGRTPTSSERSAMTKFLQNQPSRGSSSLDAMCQTLFGAAEFRLID